MEASTTTSDGVPWWKIFVIVVLQLVSAFFNGLNLGVMGLDPRYLELLTMGPFENKADELDAKRAKKILPLRKRTNLLLVTILLWIIMSNTLVSIFLSQILGGLAGFFISTAIIVITGEIIP
jgi:metal transporter CNNM